MNYNVDEKGYYGDFGGAFIPEMLYPNVTELRESYLTITEQPEFKKEVNENSKLFRYYNELIVTNDGNVKNTQKC